MPYIPILNNDYLLATFLAFIPGHFPVAEKLWTSWFKNFSPLVVHFWVKIFVILLAVLSVGESYVHFILFEHLPPKIIFGLAIGFLFFLIEFRLSQSDEKINTTVELIYETQKNRFFAVFFILNAIYEEIIFRKYLNEFILSLRLHLFAFYGLLVLSVSVFGLIHINFGIEKCLIKSIFSITLIASVLLFHDISAAVIAHSVMNLMGLFHGKAVRLRQSYA